MEKLFIDYQKNVKIKLLDSINYSNLKRFNKEKDFGLYFKIWFPFDLLPFEYKINDIFPLAFQITELDNSGDAPLLFQDIQQQAHVCLTKCHCA